MVYVLNIDGQPLMPSSRHGKVRRLLKSGQAKVVSRCPFTIQLLYESTNHTQPVSLGVDAGSKTIGLSATTKDKVLYESYVTLRNDIVDLLSTRRALRSSRRNRKTRYRQPRFNNRVHSKHKGWLAPSIEQKINSHFVVVEKVHKILPITNIVVETASFDTQLLKATEEGKPLPQGTDYQQGEQMGFWNTREYVLFRDNHTCQCCKGKSKDKILNVHHIESRKTGGDSPGNLITLCETCHKKYHQGLLPKFKPKRQLSYRDGAFMGIMRWTFYNRLKETHPNVSMTYGYITKYTRIRNDLPKDHCIDARCISGNPLAKPNGEIFFQRKVRCHNRQIQKCTIQKGGYRLRKQTPKYMFGYQLFDKVKYNNQECFVYGRRSSGSFDIRLIDGTTLSAGKSYKKLKPLEKRKSYLIERRTA